MIANIAPKGSHLSFVLVGWNNEGDSVQQKFENVSPNMAIRMWLNMGFKVEAIISDESLAEAFHNLMRAEKFQRQVIDDLDEMEYPGKFRSGQVMI